MDLKGRVAVITGATGALGSTVTRELAAQGTRWPCWVRIDAKLEALAKSLSLP